METQMFEQAVKFFAENAGTSWDPKIETEQEGRLRGACALALAERWAVRAGVEYEWSPDFDDCSDGDETPEVREQVVAKLPVPGRVDALYASLGSIGDATDDYRRVVEAELALELRGVVNGLAQA